MIVILKKVYCTMLPPSTNTKKKIVVEEGNECGWKETWVNEGVLEMWVDEEDVSE